MSDFDTLLAEQFRDLVDHEAGPQRPAPVFVPPLEEEKNPRRREWVLAAAVILVVVGLTFATVTWIARTRTPQIASPSSATPVTTTDMPSASSTGSASSPTSSATATNAGSTTTDLQGMKLVLPSGWTASKFVTGSGASVGGGTWWCITPPSGSTANPQKDVNVQSNCVISLVVLGAQAWVDPDGYQGQGGDHVCDVISGYSETAALSVTLEATGTRSFGGRESEYRRWTQVCPGYTVHAEQYAVATSQSWVLFSNTATTAYSGVTVASVMAGIASTSTLPAQTRKLRLADRGIVRKITADASGTTLVIDRYATCPDDKTIVANSDSTTYTYHIPSTVSPTSISTLAVGDKVTISTDGTTVNGVSSAN
jgi:hypothetical protein